MSDIENQAAAGAASEGAAPGAVAAEAQPFPSLAALRAAHAELLKRCQRDGYVPAHLERAVDLIRRGTAAGALLDEDDERDGAQSLLDYWSTILMRTGIEPPDAMLAEFDPSAAPEIPDEACPYLGLDPFSEDKTDMFYGRRRLVEWLIGKIQATRMLALVGPSGSGKSSVVRAGLMPALKAGALPGSAEWRYVPPFTPGAEPLTSLARQLRRQLGVRPPGAQGEGDPPQLAEEDAALAQRLRDDPASLATALDETGGAPAVLAIDQFEELFTLCEDEGAREAFVAALLTLLEAPGSRHVLVLTLRSDFESFVATMPALQARFESTRIQLMPLNASELREAIERPAELVGLKFEPGVVDALLHDMLGEPAALPLLQFTLLKLWEQRDRNRVTWEAYRTVGGGRLALARSADAFFNGLLPEDQITARRILLRIVRPGEGLEVTSNPVRRDTLYQGGEAHDRVDRVLAKLVQARLLRLTEGETFAAAQVELAHEALVRNWPTLVQWLEDERAAVATRRRLEAKAADWGRLGRGSAGLLDERQLAEAERWLESAEAAYLGYDPALADLARASRAALDEAERQRREAEQRELRQAQELAEARWVQAEQNRQLAEALGLQKEQAIQLAEAARVQAEQAEKLAVTERWAARRARILSVLLAVMCGIGIAVSIVAVQQAFRAGAESTNAIAARATAEYSADLRATEAVALQTAEALAQANAQAAAASAGEARAAEATAVAARGLAEEEAGRAAREGRVARSGQLAAQSQAVGAAQPQLSLLLGIEALNVTLGVGEEVVPISEETLRAQLGRSGGRGLFGHSGPVTALAVTADGNTLVTGGADSAVLVWQLDTPAEPPERLAAPGPVLALALSPDGRRLVTVGEAGDSARLWDLDDPASQPRALGGHSATITGLAMSADGQFVATASRDGTVQVWPTDGTASAVVFSARGRVSPLLAVALSADGGQVLAGGEDGVTRLWRASEPTSPVFTRDARGPLTTAAFSPDGRWLVTGSRDGDLHLWQTSGGQLSAGPYVLRGRRNPITTLAVSPANDLLVCGTEDGTVRLWELEAQQNPPPVSELRGHTARITALAFSPDGARLLTASGDRTASLWDLSAQDPGTTRLVLRGHEEGVNAAAISADGRLALSGSTDGSARVWDLAAPIPDQAALPASPQELIALACQVAGRNLRPEEWARYLEGQEFRETCPAR
jgi:WD40 repeat protein